MRPWRLIDSGAAPAWHNMALDEALAMEAERPVLRLYGWSMNSVSIGCFQDAEEVDLDYVQREGIDIVRRITGGRGILHGHELTYSFSAPTSGAFAGGLRKSYKLIGLAFTEAFRALGLEPETSNRMRASASDRSPICFESASFGEIKVGGRKIVGSAQKRWPGKFLQQGSIPFKIDFELLSRVFKNSGALLVERHMTCISDVNPSLTIEELKGALVKAFEEVFNIVFSNSEPTEGEERLAAELRGRYRSPDWNLKRQRQVLPASR